MFVCVFVIYAFSPCNSYRYQTFHDTSLGPEEGRHEVGITKKDQEGVSGWNSTQMTFICLFVRYAFSPCNSYRHQTFHNTSLGPEEGRHGVGITKKGQEGGIWVKFHPDDLYIN
jgi:hypothetical protein